MSSFANKEGAEPSRPFVPGSSLAWGAYLSQGFSARSLSQPLPRKAPEDSIPPTSPPFLPVEVGDCFEIPLERLVFSPGPMLGSIGKNKKSSSRTLTTTKSDESLKRLSEMSRRLSRRVSEEVSALEDQRLLQEGSLKSFRGESPVISMSEFLDEENFRSPLKKVCEARLGRSPKSFDFTQLGASLDNISVKVPSGGVEAEDLETPSF
jgi:hypothetical protein